MQSVITWEQLLIGLPVLLLCYYAVVLFVFYRHDLLFFHASKAPERSLAPQASRSSSSDTSERDTILYNSVHDLMEDLKPVFHEAVARQLEKDQVLDALRVRVQRYPQIKGTAFQVAVTNHISQEMEHRLAMTLTDIETDGLWL